MKRQAVILTLCTLFCWSCQNETEQITSLKGTKWKLEGIVDAETNELRELEPKGCIIPNKLYSLPFEFKDFPCYSIFFMEDNTFVTYTSVNEFIGFYGVNKETQKFIIHIMGGTKVGELIEDGNLYISALKDMHQSFSLKENELRVYYNDNKNYLLFNII